WDQRFFQSEIGKEGGRRTGQKGPKTNGERRAAANECWRRLGFIFRRSCHRLAFRQLVVFAVAVCFTRADYSFPLSKNDWREQRRKTCLRHLVVTNLAKYSFVYSYPSQ